LYTYIVKIAFCSFYIMRSHLILLSNQLNVIENGFVLYMFFPNQQQRTSVLE